MHLQIQIEIIPFPEHLRIAAVECTKVVLAIGITVRGEIVELLHSSQHRVYVIQALYAGGDHDPTAREGLPSVVIQLTNTVGVVVRHFATRLRSAACAITASNSPACAAARNASSTASTCSSLLTNTALFLPSTSSTRAP